MEIIYKNRKIQKICTDWSLARKTYGNEMADKIYHRIYEIQSAASVEMMVASKIGRCRPLSQNRRGQYAVDLVRQYRLVFEVKEKKVQVANILEVVDYHG